MNHVLRFMLFGFALLSLTSCGITTVPPGEVGIKVNMVGGTRGVDETPIVTGRVIYNAINERIYMYPTYMKSYFYSATEGQGDEGRDESITFSAKGGIGFRANVGIALSIEDKNVPGIFKKYRQDLDYLIANVIHNEVRDAFNRHAGLMEPIDILATRKAELLELVSKDLNSGFLGQDGFVFSVVSFTDTPLPLDPKVQEAINSVFSQTQRAKEAEQKVAEATALANQKVAAARGDSASVVIKTLGDAEANLILRRSLSADLIEYTRVMRWQGQVPQVVGGATPFINLK